MTTYQNYKTNGKTYEVVVMTTPDRNQYPKTMTVNATVNLQVGDIIKDAHGPFLFDFTVKKIIHKKESTILGYTNYKLEAEVLRSDNPNWTSSTKQKKY